MDGNILDKVGACSASRQLINEPSAYSGNEIMVLTEVGSELHLSEKAKITSLKLH